MEPPSCHEDINQPIPIEIIEHGATGEGVDVSAYRSRDVRENTDIRITGPCGGRNPPRIRNCFGIMTQGHAGNIEEPLQRQILRVALQGRLENGKSPLRTSPQAMHPCCLNRHQAGGRGVIGQAVFLLSHSNPTEALIKFEEVVVFLIEIRCYLTGHGFPSIETFHGLFRGSGLKPFHRLLKHEVHALVLSRGLSRLLREHPGSQATKKDIAHGIGPFGQFLQSLDHGFGRGLRRLVRKG